MARTYRKPAYRNDVLEREEQWARRLTNRRARHRTRQAIIHRRPDAAPSKAPRTQGWVSW